jgi:hypothetical protein
MIADERIPHRHFTIAASPLTPVGRDLVRLSGVSPSFEFLRAVAVHAQRSIFRAELARTHRHPGGRVEVVSTETLRTWDRHDALVETFWQLLAAVHHREHFYNARSVGVSVDDPVWGRDELPNVRMPVLRNAPPRGRMVGEEIRAVEQPRRHVATVDG